MSDDSETVKIPSSDHDPIENDPEIRLLIEAASKEAHEALADNQWKGQRGFCHIFWAKKKEILKEKYGIEWKTPREMNPMNFYD
jgi:hypothetical protein